MIHKIYLAGITRWLTYSLLVSLLSTMLVGCSTAAALPEVWGRVDAKEVDINSKIPGRVINMQVKEGDVVTKGQVLARIDNRDIVAQANQARAGINALESQTAQAVSTTQMQGQTIQATIDIAKAQLDKAATDVNLAESDYNRFSKLVASGAISHQLFDNYEAKYRSTQSAYALAEASLDKAKSALLQTNINRSGEAAAQSRVEQSQSVLQQVEVALDETEIKAPFAGIITAKYVEEGAMVSSGMPLFAIQDPADNWINLKIKETELSKYPLQQAVHLEGRDSSLKVDGKIIDISKKPEFATYRSTNERGDNDIITFNVKIQVNSDQIRPGMRFKVIPGDK